MAEYLDFFFQAEDGIRDIGVTGVQTCALPICTNVPHTVRGGPTRKDGHGRSLDPGNYEPGRGETKSRSEERRVGKEWRCRRAPDHHKTDEARDRRESTYRGSEWRE